MLMFIYQGWGDFRGHGNITLILETVIGNCTRAHRLRIALACDSVSIYALPCVGFCLLVTAAPRVLSCLLHSYCRSLVQGYRAGDRAELRTTISFRSPHKQEGDLSPGSCALGLEPARAGCGCGGIGGRDAAASLPAEDGYAGVAHGETVDRIVTHAPTQAELKWDSHLPCVTGFDFVDTCRSGSFGFRRYGRRNAGLRVGFGAGFSGAD